MTTHASPDRRLAGDRSEEGLADRWTWWPPSGRLRVLVRSSALLLPLATCAVLASARVAVPTAIAVLLLVLWVVAAAATGDRIAGLLAAISSGAWFDFFLTEPYRTFAIKGADDLWVTVLLVVIGLAVTEVALWGRRQEARAAGRSGYLDGLVGTARLVAEGDTPTTSLVDVVARQITEVLDADDCQYAAGPLPEPAAAVLDHDGALTRSGHLVDVGRVGLPTHDRIALPVRRGPRVLGHFLVTATSHVAYPSVEQRRVAVVLADQVAAAVDAR